MNAHVGFSACYPSKWIPSLREDLDQANQWVEFIAPTAEGNARTELRFISVSMSPATPGSTDEEFLQGISKWLTTEHQDRVRVYPQAITVDGRKSVDTNYEGTVVLGKAVVKLSTWTTALLGNGRQWYIEVVGRSEYEQELEEIHRQFLSHFHLLPL